MKSPDGIEGWINRCMMCVMEVCEFKPTDPNDIDPSELLKFWFEIMYKSAREFGYKDGYVEGLGDGAAYSCDPYTRGIYEKQAYYTDKEGNVMCDSNHEPMKIDYKKDLKN